MKFWTGVGLDGAVLGEFGDLRGGTCDLAFFPVPSKRKVKVESYRVQIARSFLRFGHVSGESKLYLFYSGK